MDDGEIKISNHVLLRNPNLSNSFHGLASVDSFLDEFLKNTTTCTHTHTCNPPGPDSRHTHTCYHTHSQVIASEEDLSNKEHSNSRPKRPSGNREAVRKYREKKKAHSSYLEEEVKKLRVLNQQLVRKLQGQAILEAEVLRLRSLLADLRGKIDNELGAFPFQKTCNSATIFRDGDCGMQSTGGAIELQCQANFPCFHPKPGSLSEGSGIVGSEKLMVPWEGNCQPAIINCQANTNVMANNGHD